MLWLRNQKLEEYDMALTNAEKQARFRAKKKKEAEAAAEYLDDLKRFFEKDDVKTHLRKINKELPDAVIAAKSKSTTTYSRWLRKRLDYLSLVLLAV